MAIMLENEKKAISHHCLLRCNTQRIDLSAKAHHAPKVEFVL